MRGRRLVLVRPGARGNSQLEAAPSLSEQNKNLVDEEGFELEYSIKLLRRNIHNKEA